MYKYVCMCRYIYIYNIHVKPPKPALKNIWLLVILKYYSKISDNPNHGPGVCVYIYAHTACVYSSLDLFRA